MQNDLPRLAAKLSKVYGVKVRVLGPYIWKKNGRKIIDVKGAPSDSGLNRTMQLARARLEVKLGRRLLAGETVDHIDDDCKNDAYDNLQLLSHVKNSGKRSAQAKLNAANAHRTPEARALNSLRQQGVKNPQSKFSTKQVKVFRRKYKAGLIDLADIKTQSGVSSTRTVVDMLEGKTYSSIPGSCLVKRGKIGRPAKGR